MSSDTPLDFIRQIIREDLAQGNHERIATRFPPEPNGYLHIGHAKSICLNFGVGEEFPGTTFLRFDDTNPSKEEQRYAEAIMADVRWLGFDWGEHLTHASDYFEQLYSAAISLIRSGHAYVDSSTAQEIRALRGDLTTPGTDSPWRERSVEENLALFEGMRNGQFADGEHVLRARIDMGSPNINLRDPTLYRIRHQPHQRTGNDWCIYPMYDFAHTMCDAFEGITHSLCTLEFEDHRPLYEWLLDAFGPDRRPRQIEFSRMNLAFTITSKRKLTQLIEQGVVDGWDDPRMPTLAGMRRRGYPATALRDFCQRVGVTKNENVIEMALLENSVRDALGDKAGRVMGVLEPLRLVLTNLNEDHLESLEARNHPMRPELGTRSVPLTREIFIERGDFMEDPPRKFFRLKPGGEVRLRYGYIIRCDEVVRDDQGNIEHLRCSCDQRTGPGGEDADRKVKGTIHWVSASHAVKARVNLYDRLFAVARPGAGGTDLKEHLNPTSLTVISDARLEPSLQDLGAGVAVQFERVGYFTRDPQAPAGSAVFHRIVTLRDSWKKLEQQQLAGNG